VYHAAQRKDWVLPSAGLTATAERLDPDRVQVALSSAGYAHFVSVSVGDAGARYSDNFVDLLPGAPRTIEIRTRDAGEVTIRAANATTQQISIKAR
jgi:hypothetical protein